jgi:hypothetical protein
LILGKEICTRFGATALHSFLKRTVELSKHLSMFFLEYVGELRIISLIEEEKKKKKKKTVQIQHTPTPAFMLH